MDSKEILGEPESGNGNVERKNPWVHIWTQTAKTLAFVFHHQPEEYIHRLYMGTGVLFVLALRLPGWLAVVPNPVGVMIQVLLAGPVGGILAGYVFAAILRMTGKWLGVSAASIPAKAMVAWTHLPFLTAWLVFNLSYLLLDKLGGAGGSGEVWLFDGIGGWLPVIAAGVIFLWGFVVRIKGIAFLFGTDRGKSLLIWGMSFLIGYLPALGFLVSYYFLYMATISRGLV